MAKNLECDNKSSTHSLKIITEDDSGIRVICEQCLNQYILRKDNRGVPEKKLYAKLYKRDILQPTENLFFKYYSKYIRQ